MLRREPKPEEIEKAKAAIKAALAQGREVHYNFLGSAEIIEPSYSEIRYRGLDIRRMPASVRDNFRASKPVIELMLERKMHREYLKRSESVLGLEAGSVSGFFDEALRLFPGSRILQVNDAPTLPSQAIRNESDGFQRFCKRPKLRV